jgi:phenylpyruvate tautomerase PptA (4-oxalocrotonate tautomerase family)
MPFARISIPAGKPADYKKTVGDVVYEAILPTLKAPEGDRFQVITEHSAADLILDPNYLGIARTEDAIIVQLTMNEGRSVEQKKAFFKAVADGLHDRAKTRREDVFINLVEVKKENWSFGNGIAQYA